MEEGGQEPTSGRLPPQARGAGATTPPAWPPPAPQWPVAPAPNNAAIFAFCLGVGGLLVFLFSLGVLFFINLPCSILACVFGVQGKRKFDRGETDHSRGLAQAGLITGIVGGVGALVLWIVFLVVAISVGQPA